MTDRDVDFHPVVAAWFAKRFPDGPTAPQREAWPLISSKDDVLVAAPTGSGKTLTAFMVGINDFYQSPPEAQPSGPSIVYLSPLKALATDIRHNLQQPLEELASLAKEMGYEPPPIRVEVRTGDTSSSERQQHVRRPPHIYVTTPESFYLLLTSPNGRNILRHVRTVIVDEIHYMAPDKRGTHLSLSLERLDRLTVETSGRRAQRIGLSATQRPLQLVADFLSGVGPDRSTRIVDCVASRAVDFAIALPTTELESVMPTEQFHDVLSQIAGLVATHTTTLIFVQSRRLAERLAHELADVLTELALVDDVDHSVAAHHGSMSHERRHLIETKLRNGQLRALVATASLELGIDIGPVDLVVQVGSPRAISTFLQRAGRANHRVGGVPTARLFPLSRHELVEAVALLDAVQRGELDVLHIPHEPIDVLMQQLVAEVSTRADDSPDELFAMVRGAYPYRDLPRPMFDEALEFISRGVFTGRGQRGQQLSLDPINHVIRPRRSAKHAAILNGGTIPDLGDYNVIVDPDNTVVGQLSEDFAIESSVGDVFLLGTHAWRVVRVEQSSVRVVDAEGAEPSVPFWFGESPARTWELSYAVSRLYDDLVDSLTIRNVVAAKERLVSIPGVSGEAAQQVVTFLSLSLDSLGVLPSQRRIVIERFFDETGSTQLVFHTPFGARVNRALGLALRKRFCVTFDFELQAAADDDAITIALGPHHSMELSTIMPMVRAGTVRSVLEQAVLPLPMLKTRWRWNAVRSLVISRTVSGARRPIQWIRMEADDLMAAVWPSLAACQENAPAGPIPIPDHVLVQQTLKDVFFEPLDVANLEELLARVDSGEIEIVGVDTATPSPLAQGILTGRPYTFLDDAPLEERRSRAVSLDRSTPALGADGLPEHTQRRALDPELIAEVVTSVAPRIRDRHELADFLHSYFAIRPVAEWQHFFDELVAEGRALVVDETWVSATRPFVLEELQLDDEAAAILITAHLDAAGPVTVGTLVGDGIIGAGPLRGAPLSEPRAATALARLEALGFAVALPDGQWCTRDLYQRLQRRAAARERRRQPTVSLEQYLNFLLHFQHVAPGSQLTGRDGLLEVVTQLQGVEIAAGEWESKIFPSRISDYQPAWLDELCLSGDVTWARLTPKVTAEENRRGSSSPSGATPITFADREDFWTLLRIARHRRETSLPTVGSSADLLEVFSTRGAQFRADLTRWVARLPDDINDGLWDLVARGLVHADSFHGVRNLLRGSIAGGSRRHARARQRSSLDAGVGEGRWMTLPTEWDEVDRLALEDFGEFLAEQMLARWGVVAYELYDAEDISVPWLYVVRALRKFEAQGRVIGGRFVTGLRGEQYATRDAIQLLMTAPRVENVEISACDPLNLTGGIMVGTRVPARPKQTLIVGASAEASALLEGSNGSV